VAASSATTSLTFLPIPHNASIPPVTTSDRV
jgi:hypothetical protein